MTPELFKTSFFYKYLIEFHLAVNYQISFVAIATCEIYIFEPLDENKSCIYRKNLEYPLYIDYQAYKFKVECEITFNLIKP